MISISRFSTLKINPLGVFMFALFTGMFFILGFYEVLLNGPQGIHFFRQTDSLSFAAQYYNQGFSFFSPQLFNLKNLEGRAACEFPILYYVSSLLYKLVGQNFLVLKLLHLIIIYSGVYALTKLAYNLLKDYLYAIIIGLFFFTSTVFNFYAFNYLPDIAALGFTFIGWFYFLKSPSEEGDHLKAFIFFTLAGLLKVTYLINPISCVLYVLIQWINKYETWPKFPQVKKVILQGTIGIVLVILWNLYIVYYNKINASASFLTTALPIWDCTKQEINIVIEHMTEYWYRDYFFPSAFYLLGIAAGAPFIFFKKTNKPLLLITTILFFGSLSFGILFFTQFIDHDYYFLTFFPLFFFILLLGIQTLKNTLSSIPVHSILKITLVILITSGIIYSRKSLWHRLHPKEDIYSTAGLTIQKNKAAIDKLQLPQTAKFLIVEDLCPNGGLLFLNRMGWTIGNVTEFSSKILRYYVNLGADYLVLTKTDLRVQQIAYAGGKQIYHTANLRIFKLYQTD